MTHYSQMFRFIALLLTLLLVTACGSVATRSVSRTPDVNATIYQAAQSTYAAYQIQQSINAEVTRLVGLDQTETATQWTPAPTTSAALTEAQPTRTASPTLAPLSTVTRTASPTLIPLNTATRTASPTLMSLGTATRTASPTLAPLETTTPLQTEVSLATTPAASAVVTTAPLAEPVHISQSGSQTEWGQQLYLANCARCHGDAGEGLTGPTLVGRFRVYRARLTAQGLYDYVSIIMPFDAPGSLYDEEYWGILAYILEQNDQLPANTELSAENAPSVRVDN